MYTFKSKQTFSRDGQGMIRLALEVVFIHGEGLFGLYWMSV